MGGAAHCRPAQTQKNKYTSMPRVVLEPVIPVFEEATSSALVCAATVISLHLYLHSALCLCGGVVLNKHTDNFA